MWHFISEQISEQTGQEFICNDIHDISTGGGHRAFMISDGKRRFFVKVNDKYLLDNFEAEAEGLKHFHQVNLFRVPQLICIGTVSEHSFLVLEYINLTDGNEQSWFEFGHKLALLHQSHTQQMYGWQEDNFIGLTYQPNQWHKKWNQFFAEQRIGFMLQLLAEKGHKLVDIDEVVKSVSNLLAGHSPISSMLHGDLWRGNIGFCKEQAVIFDPALYFGDRETDIAMTELFGKFPHSFYAGYEQTWPLEDDYQYRKSVYQLYHLLNHALLFGGNYLQSADVLLKTLDT